MEEEKRRDIREHEFAVRIGEGVEVGDFNDFSIGKYLQVHRENKNITLKSISQRTKIGPTNLQFLEKDQLDKLPDRAYVIGYVKSYSKILGLNEKESLELLEKTYERSRPRPIPVVVTVNTSAESERPHYHKNIGWGLVIFFVAVMGVFLIVKFNQDPVSTTETAELKNDSIGIENEKEAPAVVQEKKEVVITPQTLSEESPLRPELPQPVEEIPEQESSRELEHEGEMAEVSAVASEESNAQEGDEDKKEEEDKEAQQKFYPLVKKLYWVNHEMKQAEINEFVPAKVRSATIAGKQNIYITAVTGDTWLTYKLDSEPIRQFTLEKGKSLFLRGNEARLFLGNLGAVKVFLNNKPLNLFSRTGVKNLVFPQENRSKYVMPLFIYNKRGVAQASDEYIKEKGIKL